MIWFPRFSEKTRRLTLLDAAVPKLSSSEAVSVVIFPVTPEMWNNRSPSSCTELNLQTTEDAETQPVKTAETPIQSLKSWCELEPDLILHRSSNRPCSSSGSSSAMAVSAYMLMIRWPALSAVSLTYSFSSARAWWTTQNGTVCVLNTVWISESLTLRQIRSGLK